MSALAGQSSNEGKLAMMFSFLHQYISHNFKTNRYTEDYIMPKAQAYQMYYCINRCDADKFANFDFSVNFGVPPEVKRSFIDAL